MIAFCKDKRRRTSVLAKAGLNGIDYIEIQGNAGCGRRLALTFLKDPSKLALQPANILLTGDAPVSITGLQETPDDPLTLTILLSEPGDFAPYSLTLISGPENSDPPDGIDSQLASVTFSFKAGCPSPTDCLDSTCCPTPIDGPPDISYLPKEYDGYRLAMLDRLAVLLPEWAERHAADPGIALVEALAYAADRLSYRQDAVHTEAYLGTARSRISLRRHARLVDYRIGEGCNARVWVHVEVDREDVALPVGTLFYPRVAGLHTVASPITAEPGELAASGVPAFASLAPAVLHPEQNGMDFYTWGDAQCCLPVGTTTATLTEWLPSLKAGDVLIFEEVQGPLTGEIPDADPTHRWAVRLTSARTTDQQQRALTDPANGHAITAIEWGAKDALPFPLCLSSITDEAHRSLPLTAVSVARGNIVAADQGFRINDEVLGPVPDAPPAPVDLDCSDVSLAAAVRPRFSPRLQLRPLTFTTAYNSGSAASTFTMQDPAAAKPQIGLTASDGGPWVAERDLLGSDDTVRGFVPEIEYDNTVSLRFGDGRYGMAAETGLTFLANYRVGNGVAGNIGRDSIAHVVFAGAGIREVRNPMPAAGGIDPEGVEHIRQVAPFAFESQLRCVTADDYGTMAALVDGVRDARGTLRWTGSWYTAFVTVDAAGGPACTLAHTVKHRLNQLRMMGTDLVVEGAILVGLRIGLEVCVNRRHFPSDVYRALLRVLVTGDPIRGTTGLLAGQNFHFGETVYSSPILAAAQAVEGVDSVRLTTFQRMDAPTTNVPAQIKMGRLELPRCDNDPDHADRGLITLILDGGR